MTLSISTDMLADWLHQFCDLLDENKEFLTELDAAIGDGDHGINMERGAAAIRKVVASPQENTPESLLNAASDAALEGVGGAAGPLYAALLSGIASACTDKANLTLPEFADAFAAGVTALSARGRAEIGDKTMFDAAKPAVDAMKTNESTPSADVFEPARVAARSGRDSTEPLQARKGRASYLGPRSIGHVDPGAASVNLIFEALPVLASEGP